MDNGMKVPSFALRLRGYAPDQVDAWTSSATAQIDALRAELADTRRRLDEVASHEQAVLRTMTSAQLMAERLVEETQDEASRRKELAASEAAAVVAHAQREASSLISSARQQARRELAAMDIERAEVRAELDQLRALLHDERLRAREGLAAALAAVDAGLGRHVTEWNARETAKSLPLVVVA